ncbi:hypothetical protein C1H46_016594 [Malus baccata]|uniref:Uncharacterized protein n=1 Tax=Malus baccata TaxID=106549 RepID=A0A540MGF7_MALBA|nr:hypothetical protein C1H46_016594 [Malus baccata]
MVEPSSSDSGVSNGNAQELVTFWSRPTLASLTTSSNDMSSSGNHSSTTESSSTATDAPSVVDGKARGSAGDSSRNSNALIKATNGGQSGIPIFQGKGGIDAAAALSLYWPDLKDKVAGLALAQSPYGGSSSIATDILREGQLGDYVKLRKLMQIVICQVIKLLYSSLSDNPSEADASQVCEALLALLVKAGQNKRRDNGTKDE